MKRNPKITYFLGAGASYNSVPVINELQKQLGELPKQISSQNHFSGKYNNEIEKFNKYLRNEIQKISSNNLFSYLLSQPSETYFERSLNKPYFGKELPSPQWAYSNVPKITTNQ